MRNIARIVVIVALLAISMLALMPLASADVQDDATITVPIPLTPCKYTINAGFDTQGTPPAYANGTLTCSG